MQIKMPNWRKASTAKTNASSMPQPQDQSARPGRSPSTTPSDDGQTSAEDNDNVRRDNDNFCELMGHALKRVYGAEGTGARYMIWAPPRAAVQQFIERTKCPAHRLRITPAGTKIFQNEFQNSSLAGSFSDVEGFLHAVPPHMRSAIKKVYCFIDDDAPPTALRMYTDRWTGVRQRVNADAWKEAEKARRRATETLMELLGENLQMAQVFSNKRAFMTALEGVTECLVEIPEWPEEQAEASTQGQPQHGAAAHGHANGQGHRAQTTHHRAHVARNQHYRTPWDMTVEQHKMAERETVHRQVLAGQRRKQHIEHDPEEAMFHFDQEPYRAW